MQEIQISANDLVSKLLQLSLTETLCFLDSCGVGHLDSRLLIAGINPLELLEITNHDANKTLSIFNEKLSNNPASIFTISYDFGLKLENILPREKEFSTFHEPDIFLATFDCLIIHDYNTDRTYLKGNSHKFNEIAAKLLNSPSFDKTEIINATKIGSNFSKAEYISTIRQIQEYIRKGDTYQTNLTQRFQAKLSKDLSPQQIFTNLRAKHSAPFAAFIKRQDDCVVSISPERFVQVERDSFKIAASPIKGTRQRGKDLKEDIYFKNELLNSKKDLAENTMIVDLLRNDIGRICEFGSVKVEKLCDLEMHPSLFHLVSTISGTLEKDITYSDIIKATFPCGSITGCPKIRTMQIIDELETSNRGLSMGAIGYATSNRFEIGSSEETPGFPVSTLHTSVAIRTMVIRENDAIFNVGGGIVIDSNPQDEYDESLLKAKALLEAIGIENL